MKCGKKNSILIINKFIKMEIAHVVFFCVRELDMFFFTYYSEFRSVQFHSPQIYFFIFLDSSVQFVKTESYMDSA